MSSFYDWLVGLATIGGFAYFVLGYSASVLYYYIKQRAEHQPVQIPWRRAGIAIGITAMIVTSLQASGAYNQARQTAAEVQSCSREFHQALIDRSKIGNENDEISQFQRRTIYLWLHDIIFPPAPYADLLPSDPKRQTWGVARTIAADRALTKSFDEQDALQEQRARVPLPDPTCGRSSP